MTSYRSKPFAAAKKCPRKKPALNSTARRRLKNVNNIAEINQNNYKKCYTTFLRNNKGNVKKMSKEIWAILHHYSSTVEKPRHSNCPTGSFSWCSYQRDIANGTNSYNLQNIQSQILYQKLLLPFSNV